VLKRFILWDYPRATWQYDVMVGIILAFIFLTPRAWFRDQPRIPQPANITMLPAEHGSNVFWIDPALLAGIEEARKLTRMGEILTARTGKKQVILRVEPVYDSDKEIQGYMAFARP
jgi:hypothetical protein